MSKFPPVRRALGKPAPARRVVLSRRASTAEQGSDESHLIGAGEEGGEELHLITARDKYLIRDYRQMMRENQTAFWYRFGVTQTRGSRFERGKAMPLTVLMLMRLYLRNVIGDADLLAVRSDDAEDGGL